MAWKIVWNKRPVSQFSNALINISKSSTQNAEVVEKAILDLIEKLKQNPEAFPLDKYKINNNGDYRAFESHSFRVSYRKSESEIRILRIRYIKQKPLYY